MPTYARSRLPDAAGLACVAALAIALTRASLPAADGYTKGFAPWWVPAVGALFGVGAALAMRRRPGSVRIPRLAVLATAWSALVLLIWSAGGIVFDALRALAVLGVPGLPPVVDWPGFMARAAALAAGALLVAAALRHARATGANRAPKVWPGYAAAALVLPYPALKVYWAMGGELARQAVGPVSHEGFPVMELVVFGVAGGIALALVQPWGRFLPRWMLLAAGWTATGVLLSMGALAGLGALAQAMGVVNGPVRFTDGGWIVAFVYGTWLLLGLAFGAATLGYQWRAQPAPAPSAPLSTAA